MNAKVKGINLLPKEYIIAEKVRFYQRIASLVLAAEVACFVAFVAIPPKQEVIATEQELQDKRNELASSRYAGVNKTLNDLELAKKEMKTWISQYSTLKQKAYISGQFLDELVTRVPEGVNITSLKVDSPDAAEDGSSEKNIEIVGRSQSYDQGLSYVGVLETLFTPENITHEITYNKGKNCYDLTIMIIEKTLATQVAATEGEGTPTEESGTTTEDVASAEGEGGAN